MKPISGDDATHPHLCALCGVHALQGVPRRCSCRRHQLKFGFCGREIMINRFGGENLDKHRRRRLGLSLQPKRKHKLDLLARAAVLVGSTQKLRNPRTSSRLNSDPQCRSRSCRPCPMPRWSRPPAPFLPSPTFERHGEYEGTLSSLMHPRFASAHRGATMPVNHTSRNRVIHPPNPPRPPRTSGSRHPP